MHRFWFLVLLLTSTASLAAQEVPKAEVFGGYSFTNEDFASGGSRSNAHGWNASVTANVNHWLGLVTDFAGLYGASSTSRAIFIATPCPISPCPLQPLQFKTDGRTHTFLVGPQFSLRREKFAPFVHALIGGARLNSTTTLQSPTPPFPIIFSTQASSSRFAVALALGGGVNYKLKENLAWRVQADYVQSGFSNTTQNNLRLSTGLVFHFK